MTYAPTTPCGVKVRPASLRAALAFLRANPDVTVTGWDRQPVTGRRVLEDCGEATPKEDRDGRKA